MLLEPCIDKAPFFGREPTLGFDDEDTLKVVMANARCKKSSDTVHENDENHN